MRRQISYTEPIGGKMERFTVIANNEEEHEMHIEAITDPMRRITDILIEDLPPEFTEEDRIRADIDYLAMMVGVDLNV